MRSGRSGRGDRPRQRGYVRQLGVGSEETTHDPLGQARTIGPQSDVLSAALSRGLLSDAGAAISFGRRLFVMERHPSERLRDHEGAV